jgi:hypothetical protein
MTAFYDFFRKIKFTPGVIPTSDPAAVMTNSSISNTTLTVGGVQSGVISVGMFLSGPGVAQGTYILSNISGTTTGSTWIVNISQSVSPTTINGSLNVITQDTVIEADTITDTATIVAGRNITFGVKDPTDPEGLDQFARFTTDTVTINGPDYQTYVPLGTTRVRLDKNIGETISEVEFVADPNSTITVFRTSSNQIKIGHSAPNIPYSQEQIEDMVAGLFANGTHQDIEVVYEDSGNWPEFVTQFSTSGNGTNALFRVSVINGQYEVIVEQVGTGYQVNDTIIISGANFPNGTSSNNVTLTVSQVASIQAPGSDSGFVPIMTVVATGTPPLLANIDIKNISTLQTVTTRGNTTTNNIVISNATSSTTKSTGALRLTAGGLGVFENINAGGYIATENQLKSTVAQGTAPLVVTSTTMVSNLQAETASKWHSARTVNFATGDMAGSFTIDGSANVNDVSLTATAPFLAYIETEIAKSVPYGSLGQVPFIATESTRLTEQDYTVHFGQFIETNNELDAAKLRFESPSTIFNSWTRFSHDTTSNQPANAGELASWTYDTVNDRILSTVNSNTVIGFVSPKTYSNYVHEVRLYSPGGDDDAIGVVIAWYVDPITGRQNTLSAVRSPGGLDFTWQVIYNFGRSDAVVIANKTADIKWGNGAYGATAAAAGYVTNLALGGWDDFTTVGTKVKVVRNGDSILVSTTDFNGINYVSAADITIDLVGTAVLNKFRGPKSYGYLALSQDAATFEILGFTDTDNSIFDMRTGGQWTYAGGVWTLQNILTNNIWTTIGPGRLVYDIYTEKMFYIDTTTSIQKMAPVATALQNPRNINSVLFDGSADISFYDTFAQGVSSPGPLTFPSSSIRGFDAYASTDFPSSYIVGLTLSGAGGIRSAQLGMNWNSEETAPIGIHFRTNDDTSTTNAWSPWRRILVDGSNATFSGDNSSSTTTGTIVVTGGVGISQNLNVGGTLSVTSSTTLSDDLAVNGGDLTTNQSTFNLVNATASTVNFAGAATALNIGASTGTTTVNNNLVATSIKGKFVDVVANVATISNPLAPNWNSGSVQRFTVNQNFTLNAPTNMPVGGNLTLILTQDAAGNRVMTAAASYKFSNGFKTLSLPANAIDMLNIFYDGSTYYVTLTTGYA